MDTANRAAILAYAEATWGDTPDFPFAKDDVSAVLRHDVNRKWYALLMRVDGSRVKEAPGVPVDILNIKIDPLIAAPLYHRPGFLPAYHMNKEKWITILLNNTLPLADVLPLLDMSHEMTRR